MPIEPIHACDGTTIDAYDETTAEAEQADRVVGPLEAGICFINGFVRSDPRLQFGEIEGVGLRSHALQLRYPGVFQRQNDLEDLVTV